MSAFSAGIGSSVSSIAEYAQSASYQQPAGAVIVGPAVVVDWLLAKPTREQIRRSLPPILALLRRSD